MITILMAGAAHTGKTKTMEAAVEDLSVGTYEIEGIERWIPKIAVQTSVARSFFAENGLENVKDAIDSLSPEEHLVFQIRLFRHYLKTLTTRMDQCREDNVEVFLCDRSPYDHLAYVLQAGQDSLTLSQIEGLINEANNFLDDKGIVLWHFPYPQPWSPDNASQVDDPFRFAPPSRNLVTANHIRWLLDQAPPNIQVREAVFGRSIHWRVDDIVECVYDHKNEEMNPKVQEPDLLTKEAYMDFVDPSQDYKHE